MLARNCRSWRDEAGKAATWRNWLIGLGLAVGLAGILGYLYLAHTSTSIPAALARSPFLISVEALAFFFLRQSCIAHNDAKQFVAEADHASRILVQHLLLKKDGDPETRIAFAQSLAYRIESLLGKMKNRDQQIKKEKFPKTSAKEYSEGIQ